MVLDQEVVNKAMAESTEEAAGRSAAEMAQCSQLAVRACETRELRKQMGARREGVQKVKVPAVGKKTPARLKWLKTDGSHW